LPKRKKANSARPDTHDYSEAETRDYFIDLLLKEAGGVGSKRDREFEVAGMPNADEKGFVDYVLWGDDGIRSAWSKPNAPKAIRVSASGRPSSNADCLEKRYGRRPIIFYSNGYDIGSGMNANYPQRPVQGFYKKAELELLISAAHAQKPLASKN